MKTFAIIAALLLAGCGSTATSGADAGNGTSDAATGGNKPPSDWNALDACTAFNKGAMTAILGKPVTATTLALVNESDGTTAATSECTYALGDSGKASLMMRWSPINDNTEGSINTTRNTLQQTVKAFGGSVEIIGDLGKAAFWVDLTNSLNVYIGEDKFLIINTPSGPDAKSQAINVAKKLGA